MADIFVGTSGWSYDHWIGPIYPAGSRREDLLALYAQQFRTVEINSTFYGLPKPDTLARWSADTPPDFVFSCKASRYLTHMKKLTDTSQGLSRFFEAIDHLREKIGPILFQLPPRWGANVARLRTFISALPTGYRYAFEFRDPSWFEDEVLEVLDANGAAFCVYELGGNHSPIILTGEFVYVRLHGPEDAYSGSYDAETLQNWAARFLLWQSEGRSTYCYFDNDEKGFAALDAKRLLGILGDRATSAAAGATSRPAAD